MVDLLHDVQPLSDLPKTRVVAVEVRGVLAAVDDEGLRAPSVASRVGHAEHAFVVVLVVAVEFAVNGANLGLRFRCPEDIRLGRQIPWDDPVELQSLRRTSPSLASLTKLATVLGASFLKKLHGHGAVVGVNLFAYAWCKRCHHVEGLQKAPQASDNALLAQKSPAKAASLMGPFEAVSSCHYVACKLV